MTSVFEPRSFLFLVLALLLSLYIHYQSTHKQDPSSPMALIESVSATLALPFK